jgi:hypothetical protein
MPTAAVTTCATSSRGPCHRMHGGEHGDASAPVNASLCHIIEHDSCADQWARSRRLRIMWRLGSGHDVGDLDGLGSIPNRCVRLTSLSPPGHQRDSFRPGEHRVRWFRQERPILRSLPAPGWAVNLEVVIKCEFGCRCRYGQDRQVIEECDQGALAAGIKLRAANFASIRIGIAVWYTTSSR